MSVKIKQNVQPATEQSLAQASHVLFVVQSSLISKSLETLPYTACLQAKLKRSHKKIKDLTKAAICADLPNGAMVTWLALDAKQSAFQRHTLLRKAVKPILDESPKQIDIALIGDEGFKNRAGSDAVYALLVNAVSLPDAKTEGAADKEKNKLKQITVHGWQVDDGYAEVMARVVGNTLTRELTMLPPNALTPTIYREKVDNFAKKYNIKHEEFDVRALKKMGAGAFVAVAQGSEPQDAAIVHLTYAPKNAEAHWALVGKGVCFDTGGHNLKPARYMQGMHEDMNGSAVALGVLAAVVELALPIKLDCWLAIAQNHIGPQAYKQNDVVKALNGKTIEIVHTDAEGRMLLADTLTLASKESPDVMLDFATLTGSMMGALGNRYSGVLGNSAKFLAQAVKAGEVSGERVAVFPFDEDYEEDLESSVADIKQCTLDSEADHILAARFLYQFIAHPDDVQWLHMDLSSYNRKGGLGAVASDVNGFGVAWALALIKTCLPQNRQPKA